MHEALESCSSCKALVAADTLSDWGTAIVMEHGFVHRRVSKFCPECVDRRVREHQQRAIANARGDRRPDGGAA